LASGLWIGNRSAEATIAQVLDTHAAIVAVQARSSACRTARSCCAFAAAGLSPTINSVTQVHNGASALQSTQRDVCQRLSPSERDSAGYPETRIHHRV